MDLVLTRKRFCSDGIFSVLTGENEFQLSTLEHSFEGKPALPYGLYRCQRGKHKLAKMIFSFETFEVMNVPGHTGILFHVGNYNHDSEGCILLGLNAMDCAVTNSREAFKSFMKAQDGLDEFQLTVVAD